MSHKATIAHIKRFLKNNPKKVKNRDKKAKHASNFIHTSMLDKVSFHNSKQYLNFEHVKHL